MKNETKNDVLLLLDPDNEQFSPIKNSIKEHDIVVFGDCDKPDINNYQDLIQKAIKREIKVYNPVRLELHNKGILNSVAKKGNQFLSSCGNVIEQIMGVIPGINVTPVDIGFNSFFAFSLYYLRELGKNTEQFRKLTEKIDKDIIEKLIQYAKNTSSAIPDIMAKDITQLVSNAEEISGDITDFIKESLNSTDIAGFVATMLSIFQIGYIVTNGIKTNNKKYQTEEEIRKLEQFFMPLYNIISDKVLKGQILERNKDNNQYTVRQILSSLMELSMMPFLSPKLARDIRRKVIPYPENSIESKLRHDLNIDSLNSSIMVVPSGFALLVSGLSDSIPTHGNEAFRKMMELSFIFFTISNSVIIGTNANSDRTSRCLNTISSIPRHILSGEPIKEIDLMLIKNDFPEEYKIIQDVIDKKLLNIIAMTVEEQKHFAQIKKQRQALSIAQSISQKFSTLMRLYLICAPEESRTAGINYGAAAAYTATPLIASAQAHFSTPSNHRNNKVFAANMLRCFISPMSYAAIHTAVQLGAFNPESIKAAYRTALWIGMASTSLLFNIAENAKKETEPNQTKQVILENIMKSFGANKVNFNSSTQKNQYFKLASAISDIITAIAQDANFRTSYLALLSEELEKINSIHYGSTPETQSDAIEKMKNNLQNIDIISSIFTKTPVNSTKNVTDAIHLIKNNNHAAANDIIDKMTSAELKEFLLKKYNNLFMERIIEHGVNPEFLDSLNPEVTHSEPQSTTEIKPSTSKNVEKSNEFITSFDNQSFVCDNNATTNFLSNQTWSPGQTNNQEDCRKLFLKRPSFRNSKYNSQKNQESDPENINRNASESKFNKRI